jgi:predicted amidohydrolase
MRVTVLELPARPGAVARALTDVEAALAATKPGALTLLPEAAITGYLPDPSPLAEPRGGPTERRLTALAKRYGTVLVAPLIERAEDGRVYNAVAALGPDGPLFVYRKRHPWYVETWATAGDNPLPLIELSGLKLTACICFDVHFLDEAAETLAQADVLLFPSAWVDEEDDARSALLPAVAQKFGVTVVNANWGPGTPRVRGQGGSRVVAPDGEVLARCEADAVRLDLTLTHSPARTAGRRS